MHSFAIKFELVKHSKYYNQVGKPIESLLNTIRFFYKLGFSKLWLRIFQKPDTTIRDGDNGACPTESSV